MKENIFIWITSDKCDHCKISRKDGIMGSGGEMMRPSSILHILDSNKDISFMNINFHNMKGKIADINAISNFYIHDNNLIQKKWIKKGNNVKCKKITAEKNSKRFKTVDKNLKMDWTKFVNTKIPLNLQDYIYYYPAFLIVKTSNWVDSIKTNSAIYGITDVGKTKVSANGKVGLDRNSLNNRIIDYKQLLKDFNTGKETFVPKLDERVESRSINPTVSTQIPVRY